MRTALAVVLLLHATAARADDDRIDRSSFVVVTSETWLSFPKSGAAVVDAREVLVPLVAAVPRNPELSIGLEMMSWEKMDLAAGQDTRTFVQGLGVTVRFDRRWLGAYAGGHLLDFWGSGDRDMNFLSPAAGIRVGSAHSARLLVEATFAGAHLVGLGERAATFRENFDLRANASVAVHRDWRIQARARYRDFTDKWTTQRDAFLAAGVEYRLFVAPIFLGVGVRAVERSQKLSAWEGRWYWTELEAPGTQLLVVLQLDLGFRGRRAAW